MKQYLSLICFLSTTLFNNTSEIPQIIRSNQNKIRLYQDSKETEKIGYGNWNPYEDGEYLMIKTFIKEGDIIIDAGAHFGDWSHLVLDHTKKIRGWHR